MTATHPTDRELSDFLLGKLADSHSGEVESHVADCPDCARRALSAPADDTLTELLASARTRLDRERAAAPTPTLDAAATPSLAAPTLTWGGSAAGPDSHSEAPAVLASHPKYRVVRRLGTGGMGTVWLAEHQVMHRLVAVKVIRPDLLARPGATSRFLREVRAAAKLHHPNIVTAFDAEPADDSCLLVMEYVEGQTLGERLEAGPLPVAEAVRAVRDAARGLAHAHAQGLIHRDIKPHNLIRAADGTTKVLDFGLAGVGAGEPVAASGDGLTGAGMVVGTPDYIAPEQIADPHAADARADIYGLGCTLYHLLAGRPPLPAGTVAEKLAAQPTHQPDPIPGLPPGLDAVLAKMMAKRPEDRYQTADELIQALEPYSGPLGPRAEPARPARRPRYRRWLAIAAGILFGVGVGVVFKIERDNQIVQVEVNDPDIEVVMKRKGEIVLIRDAKSGRTWEYDTLKNQIGLVDEPDGLTLGLPENEPFVLKRKGERVFAVTRLSTWTSTWTSRLDQTPEAKIEAASRAAEAHLKRMDAGEFARAWEQADAVTHKSIPRDQFVETFQELARKNGKLLARTPAGREFEPMAGGARSTTSVRLTYDSTFEWSGERTETLGVVLEADGRWRVQTHRFDPPRPPAAVPGSPPPAPRLVQTIENGHRFPQAIAYTPDGKSLLAAGRDYFAVYDPVTGKTALMDSFGFAGPVSPVAVSADGRTAAVSSGNIFVYDLAARKRMVTIPRQEDDGKVVFVTSLALAPDGQMLAYVSGREVVYYDRATGQIEHTRPDDDSVRVQTVYYTPDGRYLVLASQVAPDQKTRVSVLNARTRELLGRCELPGVSRPVHLAGDGERLFVGGTSGGRPVFVVLGLPGCERIERDAILPPGTGAPIPSSDGRLLALTDRDGDVQVWDRVQKRFLFVWNPHPAAAPEFPKGPKAPQHTSVVFAPDGRTLATARGNQIKVWDLTGDGPAAAPAKADKDLFLGTWRGVAAEVGGQVMPKEFIDTVKPTLTFTADKIMGKPEGTLPKPFLALAAAQGLLPKEAAAVLEKGVEGVYHLDPAKSPKQIDFTILGEVRKTALGIYQLDGDTLKLCLSIDPAKVDQRPDGFATKAGEMRVLLTLRRLTAGEVILEDVERRIDPAKSDGKNLPAALLEHHGVAALRFGKWRLVFEGVPCDARGQVVFGIHFLFLPEAGGEPVVGPPHRDIPTPALRQQSDNRGNRVAVGRYEFRLEAKGARLVFADRTYEATDKVQTIVIARDGTTRLEPGPKR